MKYEVKFTTQFKKDLKLAKKQNKNLDKLFEVVNILADGGTLDARYRDHDLSGNYKGTRECHIEPDLEWRRDAVSGAAVCLPDISAEKAMDFSQLNPWLFRTCAWL